MVGSWNKSSISVPAINATWHSPSSSHKTKPEPLVHLPSYTISQAWLAQTRMQEPRWLSTRKLPNMVLLSCSQTPVLGELVLKVRMNRMTLEVEPDSILMLPKRNGPKTIKCTITLLKNFQRLLTLFSLLTLKELLSVDIAWEVMELWPFTWRTQACINHALPSLRFATQHSPHGVLRLSMAILVALMPEKLTTLAN